jgi:hypothetical protein
MRRDHLKLPGLDRRIILKSIFKKLVGNMDCINLAQDRDRCWTVVNAVMNLRVPLNTEKFLTSQGHVSFSRKTLLQGVIYPSRPSILFDIQSSLLSSSSSPNLTKNTICLSYK